MITVVLEMGRRSTDSSRLGFRVRVDDEKASVKESRGIEDFKNFLLHATEGGHDENLKPQFEVISVWAKTKTKKVLPIKFDFRWVPNSGCDQFVVKAGMDILAGMRKVLKR